MRLESAIVRFEEIDFEALEVLRAKAHRQILYDAEQQLVYKTYVPDWEFADMPERGIESGYYTERMVPNFVGLIKDKQDRNRGYVMRNVPREQLLESASLPVFSVKAVSKIMHGTIAWQHVVFKPWRLQSEMMARLLRDLFEAADKTGLLYADICAGNLWVDEAGYHLLDLDAVREVRWLFDDSKENPEYVRRLLNRRDFNRELKNLMALHGLPYPGEVERASDVAELAAVR